MRFSFILPAALTDSIRHLVQSFPPFTRTNGFVPLMTPDSENSSSRREATGLNRATPTTSRSVKARRWWRTWDSDSNPRWESLPRRPLTPSGATSSPAPLIQRDSVKEGQHQLHFLRWMRRTHLLHPVLAHSTGDNSERAQQPHLCAVGILPGHKSEALAEGRGAAQKTIGTIGTVHPGHWKKLQPDQN